MVNILIKHTCRSTTTLEAYYYYYIILKNEFRKAEQLNDTYLSYVQL